MYTTFRALIFVLAYWLSATAHAQGNDGSFYLQACGAAVKLSDGSQLTEEEGLRAIYCASYVGGFLDGMSLTATLNKGN